MSRRHLYIVLIIALATTAGRAQNVVRIDSLVRLVQQMDATDAKVIDMYNEIAWEYRKSDPDSTIYYAKKAIEVSDRLDKDRSKAQAYNYIGVGYHYKGLSLQSFEYYKRAIAEAEVRKDSVQYGHALNSLGRLYLNQGDFIKSYDAYFKALEIFQNVGDMPGVGYCYKSLSELYQTQNNYEKALEMSRKAFEIRQQTGNTHGQVSILIEIAGIYEQMSNFDKAFDHYLQAKVKAESIDDKINIAIIDLGISQLYYSRGVYEEALIFGMKAHRVAEKTSNQDLLSQIQLQLGKVFYERGDYARSRELLNNVLVQSVESKELANLRDAYFYLSELEAKLGNVSKSYDNYLQYTELNRSLDNAEVARKIERLEARFEIDKKSQENELLKVQRARDEAIIARQQIQNYALIIIVLALSTMALFIYVMSRKRRAANIKLQEKNEEIAAQREEISRQNKQINTQNDKLQKRNAQLAQINQEKDTLMNIVAHDLKSPFNRIKGISELLKLSGLNDEQKNYNDLLHDISSSGINLIRDLLDVSSFENDSRKMDIAKVDVGHIILEKAKYFYADAKSKGIEVINDVKDQQAFIYTDETYLSRILDNLISNAIKFSGSNTSVVLGAVKEHGNVKITIKDSGPGFSEEDLKSLYKKFTKLSARPTAGESSNGLGLAIVKTLVDRLGGEIKLNSDRKGSTFQLIFPVNPNVPSQPQSQAVDSEVN